MAVSILHRVSGNGLAVVGGIVLVWWLVALASGVAAYDAFVGHASAWYGRVVLIGLTWAYLQHLLSGLRHFVMDVGAGYEVDSNNRISLIIPVVSVLLTAALWAFILFGRGN